MTSLPALTRRRESQSSIDILTWRTPADFEIYPSTGRTHTYPQLFENSAVVLVYWVASAKNASVITAIHSGLSIALTQLDTVQPIPKVYCDWSRTIRLRTASIPSCWET